MKKILVTLLMLACLAVAVNAEESVTDVLDSSAELSQVEKNGIPTETIINEMKANAEALYADGKYEEAAIEFHNTANKINYLANIMVQLCKPSYSINGKFTYFPSDVENELTACEEKISELRMTRNACYVYEGVCYSKIGNKETSLAILYNALDYITAYEGRTWTLAVQEIMKIIEYK